MVIQFVISDQNKIRSYHDCIIIESASDNESIKVADALTFRMLTITK